MSIIKVTNSSSGYYVFFRLVYFLDGHLTSKSTPEFISGNSGQLQLPDNAVGTVLTVSIRTFSGSYKLIYTEAIVTPENTCYRVSGSQNSAICQKVPCSDLFDSCKPRCCCCCYHYYKHCSFL